MSAISNLEIYPEQHYLYASNRGHNSIVCFSIEENTGKSIYRNHTSTEGCQSRNFSIDPGGTFMLVANQKTNNIITFKIHLENGQLHKTGHEIKVSMPVCLKFSSL
jgi:6-phosphogluconolactonase